jgi:serine/threonine protein kinase
MIREVSTFNNKVDIWALGCVFYEIVYLKKAFKNDSAVREYTAEDFVIPSESRMVKDTYWLEVIRNIIKEMLKRESSQRPTAREILEGLDRARRGAYTLPTDSNETELIDHGTKTIDGELLVLWFAVFIWVAVRYSEVLNGLLDYAEAICLSVCFICTIVVICGQLLPMIMGRG